MDNKFNNREIKLSKYQHGDNPCGYCQKHQHKRCRVRLDGNYCSCSCYYSTQLRAKLEKFIKEYKEKGKGDITPTQAYDMTKKAVTWKDYLKKNAIQISQNRVREIDLKTNYYLRLLTRNGCLWSLNKEQTVLKANCPACRTIALTLMVNLDKHEFPLECSSCGYKGKMRNFVFGGLLKK
jgi:hypothetical protein